MGARPLGPTPGSQMAGPHPCFGPGPDGTGEDKGLSQSLSPHLATGLASEARFSRDAGLAPGLLLSPSACGVRAPGRSGPPGPMVTPCAQRRASGGPGQARRQAVCTSSPPEPRGSPASWHLDRLNAHVCCLGGSRLPPPGWAPVGARPRASQGWAGWAPGSRARVSPQRLCDSRPGEQCSGCRTCICPSEKHARPSAVWGGERRRGPEQQTVEALPAGWDPGSLSARRALCPCLL